MTENITEYIFLHFSFTPHTKTLVDQASKQSVVLSSQSAALLELLLTKPQQNLSKKELINELWSQSVANSVLIKELSSLRKALGDDSLQPKIIQTVAGKGDIRFAAQVKQHQIESQNPNPKLKTATKSTKVLIGFILVSIIWWLINYLQPPQQLEGNLLPPQVSKDGQWFLYRYQHETTDGDYRLFIANTKLLKPKLVDLVLLTNQGNYHHTIWGDDSQIFAVRTLSNECQITQITALDLNFADTNEKVLTSCQFGELTQLAFKSNKLSQHQKTD